MTTAPDLTWPALLAHWTAIAQATLALPRDAQGERWRAAVAPIIGLQAVTFALGELHKVSGADERAAALDKAEVLVRTHTETLRALWRKTLPVELAALIQDARAAVDATRKS